MVELSDKGRKLIDVAMAKDEPPPTDDSWGTLVSRLTGEGPRGALPLSEPLRERPSRRSWIWIVVVIATLLAIVVVAAWPGEPSVIVADAPPAEVETPELPPVKPRPARPHTEPPQADPLLVDAEAALADGDPDRAMALLQRHAELAPTDERAPERMGLRVLVLCAQGEREQARDEAKAFLGAHGQSKWGDRVRASCGGDERR